MNAAVEQAADWLQQARRVLFITGAGISADSGLPTYRGVGGLYEDPDVLDGRAIEDILSGPTLEADPELCWRHIARIEQACRGASPNRAHRVIAALQQQREGVVVLTQNVDGLHRAAGSEDVIPIHGTVHTLICTACDWRQQVQDYSQLAMPPSCPACSALVRPDVVLFGEWLPPRAVARYEEELLRGFDLVFSVGTSSQFPYIVQPVIQARSQGKHTVEVNPGRTELSGLVSLHLKAGAAEALGAIGELLGL